MRRRPHQHGKTEQPRKPESNREISTRQIADMITWLKNLKERSYAHSPEDFTYSERMEITELWRTMEGMQILTPREIPK